MNRRDFVKLAAAGAGAAATGIAGGPNPAGAPRPARRGRIPVAMPICVRPLVDPDFERTLEDMRERAGVNILMPFVYTHETHRAGVPATFAGFRGGNYAIPHMQYYRGGPFSYADMRAPEFGDQDALARAVEACGRHGIEVYPWIIEDNHCPPIPRWAGLYEIDCHGRRTTGHPSGPCKNNPFYRAFLMDLVEDYMRSYRIGGIMWGAERQSGFLNTLGIGDPGRGTCFCSYCQEKAQEAGIDVGRARRGFLEIEKLRTAELRGRRPRDGVLTSLWRTLFQYPELLAWENLWVSGRHELQAAIHRKAKSVDPKLPIGWHLWQNVSFSPLQRAEEDYAVLREFSDFVRPALYNNCAGERMRAFAGKSLDGIFGDLSPAETLGLLYRLLDYREAPYDKVAAEGFSADYVRRETRRAVEGLAPSRTQVWPGVDIDVPVPSGSSRCTPEGVRQAVRAAFEGGAAGIILSRNYVEMPPEHLSAAGDALRDLGLI